MCHLHFRGGRTLISSLYNDPSGLPHPQHNRRFGNAMNTISNLNSFLALLVLLVTTVFITPAYSLVDSISAPTTVLHPGHDFTLTFHTSIFIQNNLQFYAVFGVSPYPGFLASLGTPVPVVGPHPGADGGQQGGVDLFAAGFNSHLGNEFNVTLRLPSSLVTHKNEVTKYVLQTGVLGNVSKRKKP